MSVVHSGSDYCVSPGLAVLLQDAGINSRNVLARAGLSHNLFADGAVWLTADRYFGLWEAIEAEASDPLLPIRLCEAVSVHTFDPLIFAATCSRNFEIAVERVATYKRLIGPMRLSIEREHGQMTIEFRWPSGFVVPNVLAISELVFVVALLRLATRTEVRPTRVVTTSTPHPSDPFQRYFGVPVDRGDVHAVTVASVDALRPFLTVNAGMWSHFEPQLRERLTDLDERTTVTARCRAALLELLPAGEASLSSVARVLMQSTRSLQRRLALEGTTFQEVLSETRQRLACHFLRQPDLATTDVAFLLGYADVRSFARAFAARTGETPSAARRRIAASADVPLVPHE